MLNEIEELLELIYWLDFRLIEIRVKNRFDNSKNYLCYFLDEREIKRFVLFFG